MIKKNTIEATATIDNVKKNEAKSMENKTGVMNISEVNNVINKSIGTISVLLDGISSAVSTIETNMSSLSSRVDRFELLYESDEISTDQAKSIRTAATARIHEILGNDDDVWTKYARIFYARLYGDARKYASLGSEISRTKRSNFQRVLDFIEAWSPAGGSTKVKTDADRKAYYRVKAREAGYLPPLKRDMNKNK